jgi:uncharacterized protein involved in exopolysaccharide biosynthesis
MASDNMITPRRAPHLAAMFQKAYAQAVMIQGIDEQMDAMIEQREKIETEILDIQTQINGEFERMLVSAKEARTRLRAQIASSAKSNGNGNANGKRVEVEITPNLKLPGIPLEETRVAS